MSMIPFADRTITLYHKADSAITRHVIDGCSLSRRSVRSMYDGTVSFTQVSTCRIPPEAQCPGAGDVIVPGEIKDRPASQIELVALMEKYRPNGAFLVESVSLNASSSFSMPHWAARGS